MSNDWFRDLVELSPEASYVSRDNALIYLNPAALRLFGAASAEQMLGQSVLNWVAPEFHAFALARRQRLEATGESAPLAEMRFLRVDGTPFDAEVHAAAMEHDGERGIVAMLRDLSARRALEQRLRVAEAQEAVGRLAGGIAHDFNNTLSVILGHAELALLEVDPSAELHSDLMKITEAAQRSALLTQQLLAYSRQQIIAPQVLDVNDAVSASLTELSGQLDASTTLTWEPAPDLCAVAMDPAQLHQIVASLCWNARDAIRQSTRSDSAAGGKIMVSTSNEDLDARAVIDRPRGRTGGFVMLRVADTGHGVPHALSERIFEPFFTTREVGVGTGLGLSMVYGIVRQNNGFVTVSSPPGTGARFDIFLPRHIASS